MYICTMEYLLYIYEKLLKLSAKLLNCRKGGKKFVIRSALSENTVSAIKRNSQPTNC